MKTVTQMIDGVVLVKPSGMHIKPRPLSEFLDCCGAGDGIGNALVPDTIFFLRVSAACLIHDEMFRLGAAKWSDFHQANSVFLRNLMSIIDAKSTNAVVRVLRRYRAVTYYNAVDTVGSALYWGLKKRQGLIT